MGKFQGNYISTQLRKFWLATCKFRTDSKETLQDMAVTLGKAGWFLFTEVIFEPILLGFVVFLVFARLQPIIENQPSSTSSWILLRTIWSEIMTDSTLYFILLILVIIYGIIKWIRLIADTYERRINRIYLRNIALKTGALTEKEVELIEGEKLVGTNNRTNPR